jgi:hypothetical protein
VLFEQGPIELNYPVKVQPKQTHEENRHGLTRITDVSEFRDVQNQDVPEKSWLQTGE